MNLFATLLLGHLIADFPLQTNWIFAQKLKSSWGIALHVAIHLLITAILLGGSSASLPLLFILGALHFACDWYKLNSSCGSQVRSFLFDQMAHLVVLILLALLFPAIKPALVGWVVLPALLYALIPACMVFSAILGIEMSVQGAERPVLIEWARKKGISASQTLGSALVVSLLVGFVVSALL